MPLPLHVSFVREFRAAFDTLIPLAPRKVHGALLSAGLPFSEDPAACAQAAAAQLRPKIAGRPVTDLSIFRASDGLFVIATCGSMEPA